MCSPSGVSCGILPNGYRPPGRDVVSTEDENQQTLRESMQKVLNQRTGADSESPPAKRIGVLCLDGGGIGGVVLAQKLAMIEKVC